MNAWSLKLTDWNWNETRCILRKTQLLRRGELIMWQRSKMIRSWRHSLKWCQSLTLLAEQLFRHAWCFFLHQYSSLQSMTHEIQPDRRLNLNWIQMQWFWMNETSLLSDVSETCHFRLNQSYTLLTNSLACSCFCLMPKWT